MECLIADQGDEVVFAGQGEDQSIDQFHTEEGASCVACGNCLCKDCIQGKHFLHYIKQGKMPMQSGLFFSAFLTLASCVMQSQMAYTSERIATTYAMTAMPPTGRGL